MFLSSLFFLSTYSVFALQASKSPLSFFPGLVMIDILRENFSDNAFPKRVLLSSFWFVTEENLDNLYHLNIFE